VLEGCNQLVGGAAGCKFVGNGVWTEVIYHFIEGVLASSMRNRVLLNTPLNNLYLNMFYIQMLKIMQLK